MIITHQWKQLCFEVDKSIKKIEGDQWALIQVIQKEYKTWSCDQPNTFYLRWQIGEYDINHSVSIISPFHSCEFIVSALLVKEIWLREIFWWLFDRSALSFSLINDLLVQPDYDYQAWKFWRQSTETIFFPIRHITTSDDLIKESMVITSVLKDNQRQSSAISSLHWLRKQWLNWEISEVSWNGIDTDREIAHQKACSEARERNACGWIQGSLSQENNLPVAQDIVHLYCWSESKIHDLWYPITQRWTEIQRAIPGQILFYPYENGHVWKGNSNGVACHCTVYDAFENGLLELIERDAFVLRRLTKNWWKRLIPSQSTTQLIQETTRWLGELDLFILEFGVLPVILAIVRDCKKIIVAAWTGWNLKQAIQKACSETKQFLHHLSADPKIENTDSVIMRHIKWYLDENNFHAIERIQQSETVDEDEESAQRSEITTLSNLEETLKEQWVKLYTFTYHYWPLSAFWRTCLRVLSSHHLPLWFWKKVPSWVVHSHRLRYRMKKFSISTINSAIHPFG
jgi:ribosomal protein S12 methylthiotransferase accessory factor YcaO